MGDLSSVPQSGLRWMLAVKVVRAISCPASRLSETSKSPRLLCMIKPKLSFQAARALFESCRHGIANQVGMINYRT